jgi:hypothetical protein
VADETSRKVPSRLCWNGTVKAAAWVTLVLGGILALGCLLVLIDLVATKFASGSVFA